MKLPALAATFLAVATLHPLPVHGAGPITHVAIYRGPAGCPDCSENVKTALQRLNPTYQIDFVGADEPIDITPQTLARYDLYVQPGGGQDIPAALDSLGDARAAITSPKAAATWACAWALTWPTTTTSA